MAIKPFNQMLPPNDPKRNVFDLSFANNLTMKIGKLIPVFCKEVVPGDSFRIEPYFALRFMPMYFPLQSRLRCDLHFFYVRNRNLWSQWKNFIKDTDPTDTMPYISQTSGSGFFDVGSLADYLGVPVHTISSQDNTRYVGLRQYATAQECCYMNATGQIYNSGVYAIEQDVVLGHPLEFVNVYSTSIAGTGGSLPPVKMSAFVMASDFVRGVFTSSSSIELRCVTADGQTPAAVPFSNVGKVRVMFLRYGNLTGNGNAFYPEAVVTSAPTVTSNKLSISVNSLNGVISSRGPFDNVNDYLESVDTSNLVLALALDGFTFDKSFTNETFAIGYSTVGYNAEYDSSLIYNTSKIKISALPFRAYESIFNGFYRNNQVDPLVVDGRPEYDEYLVNKSGGADTFAYTLHDRYWEKDFLTTCVPTPQQGAAPLVGATGTPLNVKQVTIDNNTYNVAVDDTDNVVGINSYSAGAPVGTLEGLQEAIQYGISINDFRNVNALQQWLEKNIARGYRYKEQILSHYGVHISYEELDMPEYIGGLSEDVNVSAIYSQASTELASLGDYSGAGVCFGKSKNNIKKYIDEHGFIIGIASIVVIPSYSQLLPKMFVKDNHLDYYFPEFGHLGFQPVTYKEVTPLQALKSGVSLDNVFGYNRAWYDYLASYDEVHGYFRTSLRNYLMNREFASVPVLNKQFLSISDEEVNDVFNYTEDTDKVLGQFYFNVTAKRPIPKFGVPSIS